MKTFLSILLILALIAAGGFCFLMSTPQYALWRVKTAVNQHDLYTFERYADIEWMATRYFEQTMLNDAAKQSAEAIEDAGELGQSIMQGVMSVLEPQLVQLAKTEIRYYVEEGSFKPGTNTNGAEQEEGSFSLQRLYAQADVQDSAYQSIKYISRNGQTAVVGLEVLQRRYQKSLMLEVKMRKRGLHWQITELRNLPQYLDELKKLESARLAALNGPIRQKIAQAIALTGVEKKGISKGGTDTVVFNVNCKCLGDKEIDEYGAVITCKDLSGEVLLELPVIGTNNIKPGQAAKESWTQEAGMLDFGPSTVFKTKQRELEIIVAFNYVKFTDGTSLRLQASEVPGAA